MSEELRPKQEQEEKSPGQRLLEVYEGLSTEMAHGKLAKAHIDGWDLRVANSDDGILIVSMRKRNDEGQLDLRTFEHNDWDPSLRFSWTPVTRTITQENALERLTELAYLAERAEWETTFSDF